MQARRVPVDCSEGTPVPHESRMDPDLWKLPVFSLGEMKNYLTSGVFFTPAGPTGVDVNLSIHRAQILDSRRLVVRVVRRHLHELIQTAGGRLQAALVFGVDPAIALSASVSLPAPGGELGVAGGMLGTSVPVFFRNGICLPCFFECILLGEFTGGTAPEGPFIDLTGTVDPVREQPVFQVNEWLLREEPVFPMILPSSAEHALLMGLAREAQIREALAPLYREEPVVRLTSGGTGWLHAVISGHCDIPAGQIAEIAFEAHPSCKRLVLVDVDISPEDPVAVEWALATRFQADKDLMVFAGRSGSTLDPSSDEGVTAKWVLDARCPPGRDPERFTRFLGFPK